MKFNTPAAGKTETSKQTNATELKPTTKSDSARYINQAPSTDSTSFKAGQTDTTVNNKKVSSKENEVKVNSHANANQNDDGVNSKTDISKERKPIIVLKTNRPNSPYKLGGKYMGGIIFYIDSTGRHGLIAAEDDLGRFSWEDAVQKCKDLGDGWHLPNKDELNTLYLKRRKFLDGFLGILTRYWSSSEAEGYSLYSWDQDITYGYQRIDYKTGSFFVRPVKAF